MLNKYGFPIVMLFGLAWLIWYIWNWVTKEIKPLLSESNESLLALIDRVRMLDNDLIRLNQKLETTLELRGEKIAHETDEHLEKINRKTKSVKDKRIDIS
jgi:DNA-binding transcriptional MerR regulator